MISFGKIGILYLVHLTLEDVKFCIFGFIHFVYVIQVLYLFEFLNQIHLVLLKNLLVCRVSSCVLTNPLVQWGINCVHIILEWHTDVLSSTLTHYSYAWNLFRQVKLLSKHITLMQLIDLYCFFKVDSFVLEFECFVNSGISFDKKENLGEESTLAD